jgi:hypothetical protein
MGKHIPCQFIQGLESERMSDATAGYAGRRDPKMFRFGNATPDRVTIANCGAIPMHWAEYADAERYPVVTSASERSRARAAVGSLAVYSELDFMVHSGLVGKGAISGNTRALTTRKVNG